MIDNKSNIQGQFKARTEKKEKEKGKRSTDVTGKKRWGFIKKIFFGWKKKFSILLKTGDSGDLSWHNCVPQFRCSAPGQNCSLTCITTVRGISIPSASLRTSSTVSTGTNVSSPRTSSGTSSRSRSFSFGRITFCIPARCAARTFSLIPPTGIPPRSG